MFIEILKEVRDIINECCKDNETLRIELQKRIFELDKKEKERIILALEKDVTQTKNYLNANLHKNNNTNEMDKKEWIEKARKLLEAIKFNAEHPSKDKDVVGGLELGLIFDLLKAHEGD